MADGMFECKADVEEFLSVLSLAFSSLALAFRACFPSILLRVFTYEKDTSQ